MARPTRDTLPLTAVPPAEVEDESPAIAKLADPLNWARVVERKAVGLAFLRHKL